MKPIEVAKRAWKLPEGFHTIEGRPVYRDKKMCAVASSDVPSINADEDYIAVFPREEHFEDSARASDSIRAMGPAGWNPGAVGTLYFLHRDKDAPYMRLKFSQTHY